MKLQKNKFFFLNTLLLILVLSFQATNATADKTKTTLLTPANVLENSSASDWRTPKPENLLHLQLEHGEVLFELAPDFAPAHVDNLRTLANNFYFDGLAIIRSQDNYVVQWGDPNAETKPKPLGDAAKNLKPEFFRNREGLIFNAIKSQDAYAPIVGFSSGFSMGADENRAWLTHCYGALGVGRGMEANSGNAAELYVVTGHSPRHLDRNVTLIGRALSGMKHLSSLPRGTDPLGFYKTAEERVIIKSIRFDDTLEEGQRSNLEVLRTDTETFNDFVTSRTYRLHEWFLDPTGKIELCNVGVPVRKKVPN